MTHIFIVCRCMRGTNAAQFDSHICKLMFKNHVTAENRTSVFAAFLYQLRECYNLKQDHKYSFTKPIFGMTSERSDMMVPEADLGIYQFYIVITSTYH